MLIPSRNSQQNYGRHRHVLSAHGVQHICPYSLHQEGDGVAMEYLHAFDQSFIAPLYGSCVRSTCNMARAAGRAATAWLYCARVPDFHTALHSWAISRHHLCTVVVHE